MTENTQKIIDDSEDAIDVLLRLRMHMVWQKYHSSELKPSEINPTTPKRSVTISMYPDVSGDYVCDGKNDDVEFKAAMEYLQAVHDSEQGEAS